MEGDCQLKHSLPARSEQSVSSNSFRCALRALRKEVLEFRFSYPIEIDAQAGPRESLHYYLYSDRLSWSVMSMDADGIPRARRRLYGEVYKPAYVAWWGLVNLGHFLRRNNDDNREIFLRQVDWLEDHATTGPGGSIIWPNPYNSLEGKTVLVAPWVSAYDQGLVISALVRGYRITRRPGLLELLRGAHRIFEIDADQGGVRKQAPRGAIYAEIPSAPAPGILDGFLTSLLGLYDLSVETGDPAVAKLFRDGVEGLKSLLPAWDYRQKWSWYANGAYLCPPIYHILNRTLLNVVSRLASEPMLAQQAERWNPDRLSTAERCEIYLLFLLSKNWRRLRLRTWRNTPQQVRRLAHSARLGPSKTLSLQSATQTLDQVVSLPRNRDGLAPEKCILASEP